jgi:hypothetical protein
MPSTLRIIDYYPGGFQSEGVRVYMAAISRTVIGIKEGNMADAYQLVDAQSHLASEIDGMIGFLAAQTGENELTVMGVYESTKAAEAATPVVMRAMGTMASLMEGEPNRGIYPGVWFSE